MKKRTLVLSDDQWRYPAMEMLQAFDPSGEIEFADSEDQLADGITAKIEDQKLRIAYFDSGQIVFEVEKEIADDVFEKEAFKKAFYRFLSHVFRKELPWGTLTGIKPVKIAHEMMYEGQLSKEAAASCMQEKYLVSSQKAELAAEMAEKEMTVVHGEDKEAFNPLKVSVYLGVPICPAKCSYCSFVSTIADKKGKLVSDYLKCLLREIEVMNAMIREQNLTVDTLYIGGGTPSIFSEEQLENLLQAMSGALIHPNLREFTFESGRPETTTAEKLIIMKAYGVDRICLNPQSMNSETLAAVNRHHTAQDIIEKYEAIRKIGFKTVNMDLIVGLAGESPEAFLHSLDEVIKLEPENLTIHSLAVKHGSAIRESHGHEVVQLYHEGFYREIQQRLCDNHYYPYYLYRQKYTQGSGENIGYSKPGHEGIYNILMMAERQTIIGIGAGSSGKVYDAAANRFEKVFTVKDIRTYNQKIDEVIDKKMRAYTKMFNMN